MLFLVILVLSGFVLLFINTGEDQVKADISRLIHNSSPKKAGEVYTLLFKKPADSCLTMLNFKDQVIPKIDCCIWMEVELCKVELNRLISQKKFSITGFSKADSLDFLHAFADRPNWWAPQSLGDSLIKLYFKFDEENEQTIFFSKDSSRVFICDQAL